MGGDGWLCGCMVVMPKIVTNFCFTTGFRDSFEVCHSFKNFAHVRKVESSLGDETSCRQFQMTCCLLLRWIDPDDGSGSTAGSY